MNVEQPTDYTDAIRQEWELGDAELDDQAPELDGDGRDGQPPEPPDDREPRELPDRPPRPPLWQQLVLWGATILLAALVIAHLRELIRLQRRGQQ